MRESNEGEENAMDVDSLNKKELVEELKKRGLSATGNKVCGACS